MVVFAGQLKVGLVGKGLESAAFLRGTGQALGKGFAGQYVTVRFQLLVKSD